jgi:O-antigen ligase
MLLLLEIVATVTRGAYLSLLFIALLACWRAHRSFLYKFAALAGLSILLLPQRVIEVATTRDIYLDSRLLDIPSAAARLEIWRASLPHFFDHFGLGYGIGIGLLFEVSQFAQSLEAHSLVLETSQFAGGFAAIAFVCLFCWVLVNLWRASTGQDRQALKTGPFLLISLVAWFWFANTTAVSILWYTPYESTMLMYIVLFTAVCQATMTRRDLAQAANSANTAGYAEVGAP